MIEIKNLYKSFGDKKVLEDVNLTIKEGSVLGLVGINGAGKSTLLRLINGVFEQDKGEILIDGKSVKDNPRLKKDMFFLPDEPYFTLYDTPSSIISVYQHFYDFDREKYLRYLTQFDIDDTKPMNNFSKGMKRRVFIAIAFSLKPKYLFLDEAFDGLDPLARLQCKKEIIDLVENNKSTIIISSHALRELEDICDCYAMIDNQKVTYSGDLIDSLSIYHKYNVGFENIVTKEDFPFEVISIEIDKRFVTIVTKLDYDTFKDKIAHLKPLLIDELRVDFEEMFILEVGNRGYL